MRKSSLAVLSLSALVALPVTAAAQLSVKAVTRNTITVSAATTSRDRKTIPANKDVSKGFSLNASSSSGGCSASASASLTMSTIFGGLNAELQNRASSNGSFFCGASARAGTNNVLVTFVSPKPVAGRLVLTIQGTSWGQYASMSGLLDVGNDGSIELHSGQTVVDAVVGPKGLPVLFRGGGSSMGVGSANSIVAALFVPTGGRFGVVGVPCGGPVFEAFYTGKLLQLQTSKVPNGSSALFAIGVKNIHVRIPPMNCILHTDILLPVGVPIVGGESLLRIPVPSPVPNGTFRMQYLMVSGGAWRTSNALTIKLP